MIITIKPKASDVQINKLILKLESSNLKVIKDSFENKVILTVAGDTTLIDDQSVLAFSIVDKLSRISGLYKLVNRQLFPNDHIVKVGSHKIGNKMPIVVIAGPCSVESEEQIDQVTKSVKKSGAKLLRGGVFKPRTSPYSFQGLGVKGLSLLKASSEKYGLPIVSEISASSQLILMEEYVDLLQVGARNMQNFDLLKSLGKSSKPILLKRGFSNTIEEWLLAAEYIVSAGNPNVILCERGIRTFEPQTRNSLDLSVIPIVKKLSNLPIIVDPSHATGDWQLVEPMALAAIVAGADGLLIEVHNNPEKALSDGSQSLSLKNFKELMKKAKKIAKCIEREI